MKGSTEGDNFFFCIPVGETLSFPWMTRNKLGVFTDLKALAMRDPFLLLFCELNKKLKCKTSENPQSRLKQTIMMKKNLFVLN